MNRLSPNYLYIILAIIVTIAVLAILGVLQNESYEEMTRKNCKQYEIVPEKYVDRVPDGCISQYFESKANNEK